MNTKMLLSAILSVVLLTPCAFATKEDKDLKALEKFQETLIREGFDVTPGAVVEWNLTDEYCAGTTDSALYFNVEPYLQVQVPKASQETELTNAFRLDPQEAIVLIGRTPPPARYFSYTPYLHWKTYPDGRKQILATLGDSVNNATVRTTGPSPFNAPIALIFTPDRETDDRVRAALQRAGYPAAIIDTLVFPASMLKLGEGEETDQLTIAMRNAIWEDTDAGDAYIENPPLTVYRVTPLDPAAAAPFPAPPLRVRGTGQSEMELAETLDALREGIIDANGGLQATDIVTIPMCYEGYDLIQHGNLERCGDSRDAFYVGAGIPEYDPDNHITLAEGEFLMLYGVNHVASGKATYMNTNIYASETAKLTLGAVGDMDFPNTAAPYLPGDPNAPFMYAYKVSRDCGGEGNCLQLAAPDGCTRLTLDSETLLGVFTRIYLEPATSVGPAMPEVIYDRVLKFSPAP